MTITTWRWVGNHRRNTVVIVIGAFVASGPGSRITPPANAPIGGWVPAVVLAAIACAALFWHESHPRTTAAVAIVCAVAVTALGYLLTPLLLAPVMAALYWLAARTDRRTNLVFAVSTCVLVVGTALVADPASYGWPLKSVGPTAWLLMSAALGDAQRTKEGYLDAVRARAEYAERTREAEARRRVAAERTRIARELHDVVAHHVTLAHAQASTAAHLVRTRPDQAAQILTSLTATTSSALRDLKATVGLLRDGDDPDAPLEPAPSLAQLPELARVFAAAGLTVTITTRGDPPSLSPVVDLTAFRIAQEALTNVAKHAATGSAYVDITYSPSDLTLKIINGADDGRRRSGRPDGVPGEKAGERPGERPGHRAGEGADGGFGLISMRERASSVGGHLEAGSHPEFGFHVTAVLPLQPRKPTKTEQR
ncbi:two-component sensor histidine kinase [Frankia sp. CcI49]|uniref:sensor histidine kinase n=1 Tax=Frankia sp. CcI49 TaxID=1745382 RepID=UPI000977A98B|nr:sensor histidine kinase [Frankia sp. CcI49]ONH62055.1 two-component sensor histidine kinase [Frankia sp. CcI49]